MLFLQYIMKKFNFNQVFRSKTLYGFAYRVNFCQSGFPPPSTASQPSHLDVGKNAAAVRVGVNI